MLCMGKQRNRDNYGYVCNKFISHKNIPKGSLSFLRNEIRRERDRERRSVVVPEWAVVHSDVSCSDWLLVSLAALWDLNIFLQKSFLPKSAPGICSSLIDRSIYTKTQSMHIFDLCITNISNCSNWFTNTCLSVLSK